MTRLRPGLNGLMFVLSALAAGCGGGGTDHGSTQTASAAESSPADRTRARPAQDEGDRRAFNHGIEAVQGADGRWRIFFSSSGLPPTGPDDSGAWQHDVYVSSWGPEDARISAPHVLIRKPEAQEPVSAARTDNGHVMLSFEDGWNSDSEVSQRYAIYDEELQPVAPYPQDVEPGGHSGHVAATADKFVVFYSDGWINGGGVDDLGTGNGVYAKVYDTHGRLLHDINVAHAQREWWPMVAASPRRALLVWQRYVPGELHARLRVAVLDPETGELSGWRTLENRLQYYTYKAQYIPALRRFLVVGTTVDGHGFAHLLDEQGRPRASLPCMPATVREAGIAVRDRVAYTPAADQRLMHLALGPSSIALVGVQPSPLAWSYTGSLGLVRDPWHLHWVSLTPSGVEEAEFELAQAVPPSDQDLCR
ncbi:hypothetical protein OOT46_20440 [Aquabacterium sp. A7-Y]|uniref:hypothetical protein n=1 Tax=Aquabacterium sp. A7-Y TaxID=1349605 RepID=UPI00223CE68E|nr:hypothetical protein [Aquabacterium sp. A7-Y]MCW7540206.1 hypothetical protein [Aquabacterium sp. A7-Y]